MWAQSAVEVGRIVATARRQRQMTQSQLAQAVGVTQAWISAIEQGKDTAQIGKVLRVLSYLGVRLQTDTSPWAESKPKKRKPGSVSLDDIIAAHAAPKNRRAKK